MCRNVELPPLIIITSRLNTLLPATKKRLFLKVVMISVVVVFVVHDNCNYHDVNDESGEMATGG